MIIMRDKHVSRVWCGKINTYRYNTYRVFDSCRSDRPRRLPIPLQYTLNPSIWCGNIDTNRYKTYRVFRADRLHDSLSSCIIIEMKLYHIVSCRNELVRDAYHVGQTRIECLVRFENMNTFRVWKHKYISLQYISSVSCRQIT